MVRGRVVAGGVLAVVMVAVGGCSSGDAMTADQVRKTAVGAGAAPAACPIAFDVSAVLPDRPQVKSGEITVEVSKSTSPAADPVAAQINQGMSAIDAFAGVSIDCKYQVGDKMLDAWLVAMPRLGAVSLMAPQLAQSAHLDSARIRDFIDHQPDAGEVKLTPGGDIAVGRLDLDGDGDAALLVDPDSLATGEALEKTAQELLDQIHS